MRIFAEKSLAPQGRGLLMDCDQSAGHFTRACKKARMKLSQPMNT